MPEADTASKAEKEFHAKVPQESPPFFLKGSNAHDWGMNNRLARIFNPQSGKAVMLAFDHGYFQGPTTGLERVDIRSCRWRRTRTRSCSRAASCAA